MDLKLEELYDEAAQLGVILYNYFGPEDPRFQLVECLVKSKRSLSQRKCKKRILNDLCQKLEMNGLELNQELKGILCTVGSIIKVSDRVVEESAFGFEMPVTSALMLKRENEKGFFFINPKDNVWVENTELIHVKVFPKVFPGNFFHISQKMVRVTSVEYLLLYYISKVNGVRF